MARTTDRHFVSEALRCQERPLWRIEDLGRDRVVLITDYDEKLFVQYGLSNQIKWATYTRWERDGKVASREQITQGKRKRVLHLINQGETA